MCLASAAFVASQDGHNSPCLPTETCLASCSKQGSKRELRRCDACMVEFHISCVGIEGVELDAWVCPLCAQQSKMLLENRKASVVIVQSNHARTLTINHLTGSAVLRNWRALHYILTTVNHSTSFLYCVIREITEF